LAKTIELHAFRDAGINPKDETMAFLAALIAAIHKATRGAAARLAHVETISHQDGASTMLNKLAVLGEPRH
jgi:hypothetical protein